MRDPEEIDVACDDCGAPYGRDGWCDVVVPDDVWNALPGEPRLLCFRCMAKRLEAVGYSDANRVPAIITSGPYNCASLSWQRIGHQRGYREGCREGYGVGLEDGRRFESHGYILAVTAGVICTLIGWCLRGLAG